MVASMLLAGCLPGYSHPAPAPLIGLRLAADQTPIAVIQLCRPQEVIGFEVATEDFESSWEIEPDDGSPSQRPDELKFFETPAHWHVETSTLDGLEPNEVYRAGFVGLAGPSVQDVKFRLADLDALENDQVWSADLNVAGIEARMMTLEEFKVRARDECREHADRQDA